MVIWPPSEREEPRTVSHFGHSTPLPPLPPAPWIWVHSLIPDMSQAAVWWRCMWALGEGCGWWWRWWRWWWWWSRAPLSSSPSAGHSFGSGAVALSRLALSSAAALDARGEDVLTEEHAAPSSSPPLPATAAIAAGSVDPWQLKLRERSKVLPTPSVATPSSDPLIEEEDMEAEALLLSLGLAAERQAEGWKALLGINKGDLEMLWFEKAGSPTNPPPLVLLPLKATAVPSSSTSSSSSSKRSSSSSSEAISSPWRRAFLSQVSASPSSPLWVLSFPTDPSVLLPCLDRVLESLAGPGVEVREGLGLPRPPNVRRACCWRPESESLLRRLSPPSLLLPPSKWTPLNCAVEALAWVHGYQGRRWRRVFIFWF